MDNKIGKESPIYVQNISFKTHLMPQIPSFAMELQWTLLVSSCVKWQGTLQ